MKTMSRSVRVGLALVAGVCLAILGMPPAAQAAPHPVTITKHATLGFTASMPIDEDTGVADPPCLLDIAVCLFHGAAAFHGTVNADVSLGVDISLSYDADALNTPNAPLPVTLTYSPTPGGSSVSYSVAGNATFNFDGCSNCPATVPFSASSTPTTFTAPLGADGSVTIPGTSSGITLSVAGLDVITASLSSGLTLAPAGPGVLPGLGGAAALIQVTGAAGAPILPLEWDSAGSSQTFTLTTPSTPGPLGINLGPLMHWVSTSGNVQVDLHWADDFRTAVRVAADIITVGICELADCSIDDPSPISVFSGGLGPVYTAAGLDTTVSDAIGDPAGPLVAARIAAGFVPVPLTDPAHAAVPPLNLGTLAFGIPAASIAGAPAGTVLQGNAVGLSAVASGGTAPFGYAWTKDGAPFATTQTITDTPAVGDSTYAVTVTDSLGAVSNTASTVVHDYDFALAAAPSSLQVLTTGTNTYGLTQSLASGSSTFGLPSIDLSASGLPSGASAGFSPASGNAAGFTSTATITTVSAPAGTYALTFTGTDSRPVLGGTRSTGASLTVLTPAQAIPNLITTVQGLQSAGVLNGGQTNALLTKLSHAIDSLTNKPDQPTGCNQMGAFANQVDAFVSAGILTAAQADSLLGGPLGLDAIMAAVPC